MGKGYTINMADISISYFADHAEFESFCRDNCHDCYEIIYPLSTLGNCLVEGSEYSLESRTVLLIPPFSFHTHSLSENSICEGYSLRFSINAIPEQISDIISKMNLEENNSGSFYYPSRISNLLHDAFRRFEDASYLPETERKAFLQMLVSEIIIILSASESQIIAHKEQELGARVAKYLNSNIEKNISLDKLATRFFVSKYHLCRAFKKHSGTSVHSYVNQKRIIYAKQLIESGASASDTAEQVGFGDYSAFYRAYVRIVGKAPTKK